MIIESFFKDNNIGILVHGNAHTKQFAIIRTGVPIESECLFEQLIANSSYDAINEYLEGALLPRIWSQGNSKCIITKINNEIIALFYDSQLKSKEHYMWAKDLSQKLNDFYSEI